MRYKLNKLAGLAATASAAALAMGAFTATPVAAEECLLDSDQDGVPSAGDSDGGAFSNPVFVNSLACGTGASASSPNATAVGGGAQASGANSTAVGRNALSSNANTVAVGTNSIASGSASTALGYLALASASGATAVGNDSQASGNISTALGRLAEANGGRATAEGGVLSDDEGMLGDLLHQGVLRFGAHIASAAEDVVDLRIEDVVRSQVP